mmetsp:Transcript_35072/g.69322  ORF Transcript_35072/g.69322 Transcript_35072/m.69322 type:complete len:634 (-) Transcript_35072:80-1981(-)
MASDCCSRFCGRLCGRRSQGGEAPSAPLADATSCAELELVGVSTQSADLCFCCGGVLGSERFIFSIEDQGEMIVHPSCFVCSVDQSPLGEDFQFVEGALYCCYHFAEEFYQECAGCSMRDLDVNHFADERWWHQACFLCESCQEPLAGSGGEEGSWEFFKHCRLCYCRKCYETSIRKLCNECGFPIEVNSDNENGSQCIRAMGKEYHRECFVCHRCKLPLGSYCNVNEEPFCVACYTEMLGVSFLSEGNEIPSPIPPGEMKRSDTKKLDAEQQGACLAEGIVISLEEDTALDNQIALSKADCTWKTSPPIDGCICRFDFRTLAPRAFRRLRSVAFGLSEIEFRKSLSKPFSGGAQGEGKSGQLFFFSWDYRFIVKTVDDIEMHFFEKCMLDYCNHFMDTDKGASFDRGGVTRSLLPRYLGVYTIKFQGGRKKSVLLMTNVFPKDQEFKETYDLKGVLGSGRFVSEEQRAAGVKVLKDRNFLGRMLNIGPHAKKRILDQLCRDVEFLRARNRIDYSLLLGVALVNSMREKPSKDESDQWPTPERRGLRSMTVRGNTTVPGEEAFFLGIIDVLQKYTDRKKAEAAVKGIQFRLQHAYKAVKARTSNISDSRNAVSAASPTTYADRFVKFMKEYTE